MINPNWVGLFLQILCCFGSSVDHNENLLSTVVLYRHGDRAPESLYPNDPYAAEATTIWPEGFGQLTKIGKQQQYALGKWLRTRYDGFLPNGYYHEDVKVYSSDADRCLMSAAANLAGLYQPEGEDLWNPPLPWEPIPIHTTPHEDDNVLYFGKSCPKYEKIYDDLMQSDLIQDIILDNKDLFDYVSANAGYNVSDVGSLTHMWNTLQIEQLYNLTLPEWTQKVFPNKMKSLVDSSWSWYTYTYEMSLFRSGRLIDIITTHFEETAANTTITPKLLMFSAHDGTIADLLNSLNIFDDQYPEYTSTVILELRQAEGQPYVNIFYKKGARSDEVEDLTVFRCSFDCNLDKFQEIVKPIRANSTVWDLACKLDS